MALCSDTGEGGDSRTMGANVIAQQNPGRFSQLLEFERSPKLRELAAAHLRVPLSRLSTVLLLGAAGPGEASGGGWHKDALHSGVKALLYLDDVDASNCPFAMLHNYSDATLIHNGDPRHTRFEDDAIHEQVARRGARIEEVHAPRGTAVVFETSSVHRGMPCQSGPRMSVTIYYNNPLRGRCTHGKGIASLQRKTPASA